MSKLDAFLRLYDAVHHADAIRELVAEDKADAWKRESTAAMERRARLNGPHSVANAGPPDLREPHR